MLIFPSPRNIPEVTVVSFPVGSVRMVPVYVLWICLKIPPVIVMLQERLLAAAVPVFWITAEIPLFPVMLVILSSGVGGVGVELTVKALIQKFAVPSHEGSEKE